MQHRHRHEIVNSAGSVPSVVGRRDHAIPLPDRELMDAVDRAWVLMDRPVRKAANILRLWKQGRLWPGMQAHYDRILST